MGKVCVTFAVVCLLMNVSVSGGSDENVTDTSTLPSTTAGTTTESSCFNESTCTSEVVSLTTPAAVPNITRNETAVRKRKRPTLKPDVMKEVVGVSGTIACSCNVLVYFCDINCCCDPDCTPDQKLVFSTCEKTAAPREDRNYCKYMESTYENNTLYEREINRNGLFCIVKSNLPKQYIVQERQKIDSFEDAETQIQNRYSWPNVLVNFVNPVENTSETFRYGRPIWVLKMFEMEQLWLPSNFVTNNCIKKTYLKYLENFKSKCVQQEIHDGNDAFNAERYASFAIIANSGPFNLTFCPKNVCVQPQVRICEGTFQSCQNVTDLSQKRFSCHLSFAHNKKYCFFAVHKIRYDFYHNGTKGITKTDVFLVLKNVSYSLSTDFNGFVQEFEANFYWHNYTTNFSSIRSGNPGYLTGAHVLTANLIRTIVNETDNANKTHPKTTPNVFRSAHQPTDNFLTFPRNVDSFCKLDSQNYEPVQFGFNSIAKCNLRHVFKLGNASEICRNFQRLIFHTWSLGNYVTSEVKKVVAGFGNSSVTEAHDWQEILLERQPREILNASDGRISLGNDSIECRSLVSKLKVRVLHSRVHAGVHEEQERIVGVSYAFGAARNFSFVVEKQTVIVSVPVEAEVAFFDVTRRKVKKFADPPTFKIRLPYDFFYPFIKIDSGGPKFGPNVHLILCVAVVFKFLSNLLTQLKCL